MTMEVMTADCYCGQLDPLILTGTLQCLQCKKRFHENCLHEPIYSPLRGDTFYNFKCASCGQDGEEEYERAKMSWLQVVSLTLFNLQLGGGGKCGFFRWREHVCAFIDKHWSVFFGNHRKKTSLWHGTVAGTLSQGCPQYFLSGSRELGEPGWWKLTEMKPPIFTLEPAPKVFPKKSKQAPVLETEVLEELEQRRPRRAHPFSLSAAMDLKAKRSTIAESKRRKKSFSTFDSSNSCHDPVSSASVQNCDLNIASEIVLPSCLVLANNSEKISVDSYTMDSTSNSQDISTFNRSKDHIQFSHSVSDQSLSLLSSASPADLPEGEDIKASGNSMDQDVNISNTSQGTNSSDTSFLLIEDNDREDDDLEIDPGSMSPTEFDTNLSLQNYSVVEELILNMKGNNSLQPPNQNVKTDSDVVMDSEGSCEEDEESEGSDEEEAGDSSNKDETDIITSSKVPVRRRCRMKMGEIQETDRLTEEPSIKLHMISLYEENLLLKCLNTSMSVKCFSPKGEELPAWKMRQLTEARNRLRRKFIVRQLKRENGLPLFELDAEMARLSKKYWGVHCMQQDFDGLNPYDVSCNRHPHGQGQTLDRFWRKYGGGDFNMQPSSYRTRLVGFEDDQLQPITSPYTMRINNSKIKKAIASEKIGLHVSIGYMRVLKPFILRDSETRPLKVRLLQEIIAYPHREDSHWKPQPSSTIDYCYVRPQHIPSVNALCQEFFWPGIDLSECLQYPDFSCVVLYNGHRVQYLCHVLKGLSIARTVFGYYRADDGSALWVAACFEDTPLQYIIYSGRHQAAVKLVIAFAFMVPDVKYNEAYISFIFTHPEWRNACIAKFMLYHLIQTCMGKDVTLHVSATNSAMMLYQKFGFKAEELCLNFYDKYFPVSSRECKHAFFMRLRR